MATESIVTCGLFSRIFLFEARPLLSRNARNRMDMQLIRDICSDMSSPQLLALVASNLGFLQLSSSSS